VPKKAVNRARKDLHCDAIHAIWRRCTGTLKAMAIGSGGLAGLKPLKRRSPGLNISTENLFHDAWADLDIYFGNPIFVAG
jgi:hypothetical protein